MITTTNDIVTASFVVVFWVGVMFSFVYIVFEGMEEGVEKNDDVTIIGSPKRHSLTYPQVKGAF